MTENPIDRGYRRIGRTLMVVAVICLLLFPQIGQIVTYWAATATGQMIMESPLVWPAIMALVLLALWAFADVSFNDPDKPSWFSLALDRLAAMIGGGSGR